MLAAPAFVAKQVPLAPYTTLKVGGVADYFAAVDTVDDLRTALVWSKSSNLPWFIIGGGSNILVSDEGVRGLVIQPDFKEREVLVEGDMVLATYGAGLIFDECVADAVSEQWWGLENLSHIPGTVGATPIQNVGAYGIEVADVIAYVTVFDTLANKVLRFYASECGFGYRTSRFKSIDSGRYVVLGVTFRLHKTPQPVLSYKDLAHLVDVPNLTPESVRQTVIAIRAGKFPDWHVVGTAGSFFKNPIISIAQAEVLSKKFPDLPVYPLNEEQSKLSLGYILDKICHLRGYTIGPVRLYEQQALVLVAQSGSTANLIDSFADKIADEVFSATKIKIEREVVSWF